MRHFIFKIFLVVILSCQTTFAGFDYEAFTKYAEKTLKEWGAPGGAIAIVKDGQVTYIKCFGVRAIDGKKPVTEDTQFMIVSLTKAFTAALLMRLEGQKAIDIRRPVQSYLRDFKLHDSKVTS